MSDYKAFFAAMRPEAYLAEGFAQNTHAEIHFAIESCGLKTGQRVLDMGCGPGRHALELARRGLLVTGVDFTPQFIAYAKGQAVREGLEERAEFVLGDARDFVRARAFDAALCLCEGGFALLQSDDDNVRVLRHIAASLRPGAPFLLTTLNGYRSIRRAAVATVVPIVGEAGSETTLDPLTMVEHWTPAGGRETFSGRHYIVPELVRMHREAGLSVENVWGGTAGRWARRPLEWDEVEVMLQSRKEG